MSFVVDVSVVAAWLLPDEHSELAERARSSMVDEDALAPDLLRHEIRSILIVSERRNRITAEGSASLLLRLRDVPLKIIDVQDDLSILQLARQHRLSSYDATYLTLALTEGIPLVTLDKKLRAAAEAAGLPSFQ